MCSLQPCRTRGQNLQVGTAFGVGLTFLLLLLALTSTEFSLLLYRQHGSVNAHNYVSIFDDIPDIVPCTGTAKMLSSFLRTTANRGTGSAVIDDFSNDVVLHYANCSQVVWGEACFNTSQRAPTPAWRSQRSLAAPVFEMVWISDDGPVWVIIIVH